MGAIFTFLYTGSSGTYTMVETGGKVQSTFKSI